MSFAYILLKQANAMLIMNLTWNKILLHFNKSFIIVLFYVSQFRIMKLLLSFQKKIEVD